MRNLRFVFRTMGALVLTCFMAFSVCSCATGIKSTSNVVEMNENRVETSRNLEVNGITSIKNDVSLSVNYSQGKRYSALLKGRPEDLDMIDAQVQGNKLILSVKKKYKEVIFHEGTTLILTTPSLDEISNSGTLQFTAGDIHFHHLTVNSYGSTSFSAGKLSVNRLDLHNGGSMKFTTSLESEGLKVANYGNLRIDLGTASVKGNVELDNSGSYTSSSLRLFSTGGITLSNYGSLKSRGGLRAGTTLDINNSGSLTLGKSLTSSSFRLKNYGSMNLPSVDVVSSEDISLDNSGVLKLVGSFKTSGMKVSNDGMLELTSDLTADMLDMNVSGSGKLKATFKGKKLTLRNSGVVSMDVTVDCKELHVTSSGKIHTKISGTADKTNIDGVGSSHVDISDLNKF